MRYCVSSREAGRLLVAGGMRRQRLGGRRKRRRWGRRECLECHRRWRRTSSISWVCGLVDKRKKVANNCVAGRSPEQKGVRVFHGSSSILSREIARTIGCGRVAGPRTLVAHVAHVLWRGPLPTPLTSILVPPPCAVGASVTTSTKSTRPRLTVIIGTSLGKTYVCAYEVHTQTNVKREDRGYMAAGIG